MDQKLSARMLMSGVFQSAEEELVSYTKKKHGFLDACGDMNGLTPMNCLTWDGTKSSDICTH